MAKIVKKYIRKRIMNTHKQKKILEFDEFIRRWFYRIIDHEYTQTTRTEKMLEFNEFIIRWFYIVDHDCFFLSFLLNTQIVKKLVVSNAHGESLT